MSARLLILIAVAGILAIGFALRPIEPEAGNDIAGTYQTDTPESRKELDDKKKPLILRVLPGEEPVEPPVFHVDVEVDRASGKNRLVFHVSEEHGYYVQRPTLRFWYTDGTVEGFDDSPLPIQQPFELYLKANDTLTSCIELVPPELELIDGDIGSSENWQGEVHRYGRARDRNPDPLPLIGDAGVCN